MRTPKLQRTVEQPSTGQCWIPLKKDTPCPRTKEKPQRDGRRGEIVFRIKPHAHQRSSEGSNKTLCAPGPRDPTRDWATPAFQCLSLLYGCIGQQCPAMGTGALAAADLGGVVCKPHHRATKQATHKLEDNQIIMPKKFSHCCESSRAHNRFPNLGIQQRDWEPPGNLILKASGLWLQNLHRTRETDSWKAQTKPCVHQDPGERSSDPTREWARLACEYPGDSSGGMGGQWLSVASGALNLTVLT